MKKLTKIAEAIADYYKSKYYDYEILKFSFNNDPTVEVIFYSYWEPITGHRISYTDSQDISISDFIKIKNEDPELYLNIIDLIDEPENRTYQAIETPRSDEEKQLYFEKLVTKANIQGTGDGRLSDVIKFLKANKNYGKLRMFRRVRKR